MLQRRHKTVTNNRKNYSSVITNCMWFQMNKCYKKVREGFTLFSISDLWSDNFQNSCTQLNMFSWGFRRKTIQKCSVTRTAALMCFLFRRTKIFFRRCVWKFLNKLLMSRLLVLISSLLFKVMDLITKRFWSIRGDVLIAYPTNVSMKFAFMKRMR